MHPYIFHVLSMVLAPILCDILRQSTITHKDLSSFKMHLHPPSHMREECDKETPCLVPFLYLKLSLSSKCVIPPYITTDSLYLFHKTHSWYQPVCRGYYCVPYKRRRLQAPLTRFYNLWNSIRSKFECPEVQGFIRGKIEEQNRSTSVF